MKRLLSLMVMGLMLWNVSVWADKEPVYDDYGEVMTEEEIRAYMGSGYRGGCTTGGGVLSLSAGLIVGILSYFWLCGFPFDGGDFHCDDATEQWGAFFIGFIPTTAIGITSSYYLGKHFDRQRAITRIKAERRLQREAQKKKALLPDDERRTNGFYVPLLRRTF